MPFFESLHFATQQLGNRRKKLGNLLFLTFARLCGHLYQQCNQTEMFIEPQTLKAHGTDTLKYGVKEIKKLNKKKSAIIMDCIHLKNC